MTSSPALARNPDDVFVELSGKGGRSQRQTNLKRIHEVCRTEHASGSKDFSVARIGKIIETEGIMRARALYNAASADYRNLIEAWSTYAGPPPVKPPQVLATHDYLMRIADPAIRSIMQSIIVERDKLKAQLNTLKSRTEVVIDKRPLGATVVSGADRVPNLVLTTEAQLTDSERQALRKAVSAEFLKDQGWVEIVQGAICTDRGRAVFDPGYATAIRKVLGIK